MKLYANIKALREKLELSQEELARKVGYKDRTSIAKIEAGKIDIPQSKIYAFAEALHVSPEELMGLNNDSYYMRLLFDAAEDMSKDDIDFVVNLIEGLKKREGK